MTLARLRIVLNGVLAAILILVGGCAAPTPAPIPTTNETQDAADTPLPRPEEALAYLQTVVKDKSRLIEVYDDQRHDGVLDRSGRGKLRKAITTWWKDIETVSRTPKPGEPPFRVTPDMGIRIYPPGSAEQQKDAMPIGDPDLQIMIFKAREISRIVIVDPNAGRLNLAVYIIPSTGPMDWVKTLFAGKL